MPWNWGPTLASSCSRKRRTAMIGRGSIPARSSSKRTPEELLPNPNDWCHRRRVPRWVNQYRNFAAGFATPPAYWESCRSVLTRSWTGQETPWGQRSSVPRRAPPGGGTSPPSPPASRSRTARSSISSSTAPPAPFAYVSIPAPMRSCWPPGEKASLEPWTGIRCRSSGDRTCTSTISLLRSARLPPIGWGAPRTFEVLYLEPVTCLPRRERQRQELLGRRRSPRRFGRFSARRWRYTALRTGWTRSLWVAGDLEVSYEGLFELRRKSRGRAGRSRARAGGERPPCWRPS